MAYEIPEVKAVFNLHVIHITITADLLNVCGRYRVVDIDLWPISTLPVADMVFYVADMVVADLVCGRYRCNSSTRRFADYSARQDKTREAWRPSPQRWIQEPLVVRDRDERPPRGPPGSALLLYLMGVHCWEISLG